MIYASRVYHSCIQRPLQLSWVIELSPNKDFSAYHPSELDGVVESVPHSFDFAAGEEVFSLLFTVGAFPEDDDAGGGDDGGAAGVGCEGAGAAMVFEGAVVPPWALGEDDGIGELGVELKSDGPKVLDDGDSTAGGDAGTGLDHDEDGVPALFIDGGVVTEPLTAAPLPRP
jgi:hypothetical protein